MKLEDGQDLGVVTIAHALEQAYDSGLDLVEIAPDAHPPVCQVMDFGKYKFDQKKKLKEQANKNKAVKPKEIRLRPVSADHDVDIKLNQLKKFLEERLPVTVNVVFNRREIMFKDQGRQIIEKIISCVEGEINWPDGASPQQLGKIESPPRFEGKRLAVRILPK